jgi:hypothetical protein
VRAKRLEIVQQIIPPFMERRSNEIMITLEVAAP